MRQQLPVQPIRQAGHAPTGFHAEQAQLPVNVVCKVNLYLALVGHVDFARGAANVLGWKIGLRQAGVTLRKPPSRVEKMAFLE